MLPVPLALLSLAIAVWGYYWDVSWHIDRGRDEGAFANPAHWFIIVGLDGIAFAALLPWSWATGGAGPRCGSPTGGGYRWAG